MIHFICRYNTQKFSESKGYMLQFIHILNMEKNVLKKDIVIAFYNYLLVIS